MPTLIPNGFYATEFGTLRVKPGSGKLSGKTVMLLNGRSFAFLKEGNTVHFFVAFAAHTTPEVLARIERSILTIANAPETFDSTGNVIPKRGNKNATEKSGVHSRTRNRIQPG